MGTTVLVTGEVCHSHLHAKKRAKPGVYEKKDNMYQLTRYQWIQEDTRRKRTYTSSHIPVEPGGNKTDDVYQLTGYQCSQEDKRRQTTDTSSPDTIRW